MTDTTINYLSNHSMEHKLAAYRYYIERMLNLPLNHTDQLTEWQTILHIATSISFPVTLLIHSFSILSDDRSKASFKTMPPYSALQSLLLQMRISSPVFKVIQ